MAQDLENRMPGKPNFVPGTICEGPLALRVKDKKPTISEFYLNNSSE